MCKTLYFLVFESVYEKKIISNAELINYTRNWSN